MRFYRRLLAVLLSWAVLPLVFTGIVLPPFWIAAAAAAAVLWLRPSPIRLTNAWENVAGIVILGTVAAVGGWHVGPLRPLGHLLLLLAALRVLRVHDRRTFLRALPMVGLLWAVAVASSTHVALLAYLAASVGLGWWTGLRVLLQGQAEAAGRTVTALPRLRHVAWSTLAVLVLAVPLFVAIPRLRSPWVAAGVGNRSVAGFSEAVALNQVGTIQSSRQVAMVISLPRGARAEQMVAHLRGTAFDLLRTGQWVPRRAGTRLLRPREGVVWLRDDVRELRGLPVLRVEQLVPERYLFLPPGAAAVRSPVPLAVDASGGIVPQSGRRQPLSFEVWVADGRRTLAPPRERDLYVQGHRDELRRLAEDAVGDAQGTEARAERIVRYLQGRCRYSLTVEPPPGRDPVLWFLEVGRRGHCEFFAGSMVLLLRSLEVPARMVGGYAGGDLSPEGDEVFVRQANAHTWVEVWGGAKRGWLLFDPTPAEGIPGLGGAGTGLERLRWAWESVQVTWDRWILTFGSTEQNDLLAGGTFWLLGAARGLTAARVGGTVTAILVLLGLVILVRRTRGGIGRRPVAAAAMETLGRRLAARGSRVSSGATVRHIGAAAVARWPWVGRQVSRLVCLAEEELYSSEERRAMQEAEARELWRDVRRGLRARPPRMSGSPR